MSNLTRLAILALAALTFAACSGGSDEEPSPTPAPMPETFIETFVDAPYADGSAEGIQPFYREPQPTAAYVEPVGAIEFQTTPAATVSAEEGMVWAVGDLQIRPLTGERLPQEIDCEITSVVATQLLYFTYLPLGTIIDGPPYQMLCDDGTVMLGGQSFKLADPNYMVVQYELDAPILRGLDFAMNVQEVTFSGLKGLLVDTSSSGVRGAGVKALIAIDHGYIYVQGAGMPAEEVLRVLAGIQCPTC
jgi:hypothetical protein